MFSHQIDKTKNTLKRYMVRPVSMPLFLINVAKAMVCSSRATDPESFKTRSYPLKATCFSLIYTDDNVSYGHKVTHGGLWWIEIETFADGRQMIGRRHGEHYTSCCVHGPYVFRGRRVMVWAVIMRLFVLYLNPQHNSRFVVEYKPNFRRRRIIEPFQMRSGII